MLIRFTKFKTILFVAIHLIAIFTAIKKRALAQPPFPPPSPVLSSSPVPSPARLRCAADALVLFLGHPARRLPASSSGGPRPRFVLSPLNLSQQVRWRQDGGAFVPGEFEPFLECAGAEEGGEGVRWEKQMRMGAVLAELGWDMASPLAVSGPLQNILGTLECVADYAAEHVPDARLDFIRPTMDLIVDANTVPGWMEEGDEGFGQLVKCLGANGQAEDGEDEGADQDQDDVPVFVTRDTIPRIWQPGKRVVELNKLRYHKTMWRLFANHLVTSDEMNAKIAGELTCVTEFLVRTMRAKTTIQVLRMEEREWERAKWMTRRVVKEWSGRGEEEKEKLEQCGREKCGKAVVRRRAVERYGVAGAVLDMFRGDLTVPGPLTNQLDALSLCLAETLALHFPGHGYLVGAIGRNQLQGAALLGTAPFRLQLYEPKVLGQLDNNGDRQLVKKLMKCNGKGVEGQQVPLEARNMKELVEYVDMSQLFLGKEFMEQYFDRQPGERARLLAPVQCVADFMLLHRGWAPNFGANGAVSLIDGFPAQIHKNSEAKFGELAKCVGPKWVRNGDEGDQYIEAGELVELWGPEHYRVSAQLRYLLYNFSCIADHLLLNSDSGIKFKLFSRVRARLNAWTFTNLPAKMVNLKPGDEHFDTLWNCIDESDTVVARARGGCGGYRILGRELPALKGYGRKGQPARIQLDTVELAEKLGSNALNFFYVRRETLEHILRRVCCISDTLYRWNENLGSHYIVNRESDGANKWGRMVARVIDMRGVGPSLLKIEERIWTLISVAKEVDKMVEEMEKCFLDNNGGSEESVEKGEKPKRKRQRTDQGRQKIKGIVEKVAKLVELNSREVMPLSEGLTARIDKQSLRLAQFLAHILGPRHIVRVGDDEDEQLIATAMAEGTKWRLEVPADEGMVNGRRETLIGRTSAGKPTEIAENGKLTDELLHRLDRHQMFLLPLFDVTKILPNGYVNVNNNSSEKGLPSPQQSRCAICQEELEHGEMVKQLPNCLHFFHANCLVPWLKEQNQCPLCRETIFGPKRRTVTSVDSEGSA